MAGYINSKTFRFMRILYSALLFLLLSCTQAYSQSFDDALEFYNNEEYEQAVEIFINLNDDRADLFAGKSYFALFNYSEANRHLRNAANHRRESIRHEAVYTLSLSHFGLKNYGQTLVLLYDLIGSENQTGIKQRAARFYNQVLSFLTKEQRSELLHTIEKPGIQYDLVSSSKRYLNTRELRTLASELLDLTSDTSLRQRIESEFFNDSELRTIPVPYPVAPDGTVYTVGVVLPVFPETDPDFTIPRNLYYGMVLAADEFNSHNPSQKINLIFKNSAENADTTAAAFTELVTNHQVDAVIGPLFSEPAMKMAELAEEYRIPMLPPLANSGNLNFNYNYTFQINPTIEIHGQQIAKFAVEELEMDTLAVITEANSQGRVSALAFRREAERLGAHISYFIERDFESTGYDFGEITDIFIPPGARTDSLYIAPSEAVYAPFTGQASNTMINLLLNNLEAMRSEVVLLGSEDWKHTNLTDFQERFFEIYHTEFSPSFVPDSTTEFFREDYETRFGFSPDRFSMLGYDTATYLFQSLETAGNPEYLHNVLRTRTAYEGLSTRIFMDGNRVNQHLHIQPFSQKAKQRLEQMSEPSTALE